MYGEAFALTSVNLQVFMTHAIENYMERLLAIRRRSAARPVTRCIRKVAEKKREEKRRLEALRIQEERKRQEQAAERARQLQAAEQSRQDQAKLNNLNNAASNSIYVSIWFDFQNVIFFLALLEGLLK